MNAILVVLAACMCFGTLGTAQAIADVDATPVQVGMARLALGGGLLAAGLLWGVRPRRVTARLNSRLRLASLPTWLVVALGAGGVFAYQPLFFVGTNANGVAIGTVVALGSAPVLTGLLDGLLHQRVPSSRWFAATAVAIVGVTLVSGVAARGMSSAGAGVLWSVAAGGCYALYALSGKELMDRGWTSRHAISVLFGTAAAASAPVLAVTSPAWLFAPRGLALLLWLGVVATVLGYLLFGWGLARLPTTTVTTLTLAEPLCATLLGVGLLHEKLDAMAALGLLVLVLGLTLLALPQRRVHVAASA